MARLTLLLTTWMKHTDQVRKEEPLPEISLLASVLAAVYSKTIKEHRDSSNVSFVE